MGGNTLVDVGPIKKELIHPTVKHLGMVMETVFGPDYLERNIVGSAGKKSQSGDIDIAVDHSFGTRDDVFEKIESALEGFQVQWHPKSDILHAAVPVLSWNPHQDDFVYRGGFVQVDFVYGDAEWMRYSLFSPGDDSPFKRSWTLVLIGLVAKLRPEFQHHSGGELVAEIGLSLDYHRGLYRRWRLVGPGGRLKSVDPDVWETSVPVPNPPRLARIGFIADPHEVVRMIFGDFATVEDTLYFETLWPVVVKMSQGGVLPDIETVKERFATNMVKAERLKSRYGDLSFEELLDLYGGLG